MKTTNAISYGLLTIALVIILMLPVANLERVLAEPEVLRWTRIDTPGSVLSKNDVVSSSEISRIALGSDGRTLYVVDTANSDNTTGGKALYKSLDQGISWSDKLGKSLYESMTTAEQDKFRIWDVAVAPDDADFVAVVTNNGTSYWPRNVWLSTNGGVKWENIRCPATENISAIDISMDYGSRDIAVGIRSGFGDGNIWIIKTPKFGSWEAQDFIGDILALEFSSSYASDATVVVVYSDVAGTYLTSGIHDPEANFTNWETIYGISPQEITTGGAGTSPKADEIITADLELPSDFSGQSLGLCRCYVSIDDANATGNAGIYSFDRNTSYLLMPATESRRISTIAYYGTCSSGKLLAGEVLGDPCSAAVMTWLTESPVTCPVPCWYPSQKPPTGAAGIDNCTGFGYGNAQVAWSPDGSIAYAGTASSQTKATGANWTVPYLEGEDLDESAFSLSHNNGKTWNQLSLIDTRISHLIDIAPAPDCSTVYLASISDNVDCSGFDSVWRSLSSPIGIAWERVLCRPTTGQDCAAGQTDNAILRLGGDSPDGQVVFWAAVGTDSIWWSSDFGELWAEINPRFAVQDMAAEDSGTFYVLSADGWVQKFTYTGMGWRSTTTTPTGLDTGYSITTAYTGLRPDNDKGHVVVGSKGTGFYDVAYSNDAAASFTPITMPLPTRGNTLVVTSASYKSDGEVFAINNGGMYEWSTYYGGGAWDWPEPREGKWSTQWGGTSWPTSVTSLDISRKGGFYFCDSWAAYIRWSAASAGLEPAVGFGTEPTTRLRICGGMETDEPITVWLIDQRAYSPPVGGVWCYLDTLSWAGPAPIEPTTRDIIDCDPVSGRAGEINLKWKPRSLSRGYQIQIAKDENFSMIIADIGGNWAGPFYTPHDLDTPAMVIPPGGGTVFDRNGDNWTVPALEAGHTYYWRVKVQDVATGDAVKSPTSWRESFVIKTGFKVKSSSLGPQLLNPENGCNSVPSQPAFSWAPVRGATKYELVLAQDAAMADVVIKTNMPTSAYEYRGGLVPGKAYFWRVRAVEPISSDWSIVGVFGVAEAPEVSEITRDTELPAATVWVWLIIAIGVILDVGLIILVLHRRST